MCAHAHSAQIPSYCHTHSIPPLIPSLFSPHTLILVVYSHTHTHSIHPYFHTHTYIPAYTHTHSLSHPPSLHLLYKHTNVDTRCNFIMFTLYFSCYSLVSWDCCCCAVVTKTTLVCLSASGCSLLR
jgi:hypothetical protein